MRSPLIELQQVGVCYEGDRAAVVLEIEEPVGMMERLAHSEKRLWAPGSEHGWDFSAT